MKSCQKNRKGMTVVEVIVAFVLISMSFAIGMAGIACGAHFINAGAKLKKENRQDAAVAMTNTSTSVVISVSTSGTTYTLPATKYSSDAFEEYRYAGSGTSSGVSPDTT